MGIAETGSVGQPAKHQGHCQERDAEATAERALALSLAGPAAPMASPTVSGNSR